MATRSAKKINEHFLEHVRTSGAIGIYRGNAKDAEELRWRAAANSAPHYDYQKDVTTTDLDLALPLNGGKNIGRAVVCVTVDPPTGPAIEIDIQVP